MKTKILVAIFILTQLIALFLLLNGDYESKVMYNAMGIATIINFFGVIWMVFRVLKSQNN